MIRPVIKGRVDRPLVVAFTPWPICMNSGRKATTLRKDMDEKKPAILPQVKTEFLNSSMWMIGSATFRSTKMKAMVETTNRANKLTTRIEVQPYWLP